MIEYSISKKKKLDINDIQNSTGKAYSYKVLFGEYDRIYLSMICQFYGIHRSDPDIAKYFKLHLDDGLDKLAEEDYNNIN